MDGPLEQKIIWRQTMSRELRSYMKDTNVLLCMLGAFVPIGLIFLLLNLSDWIVKRANRD